MASVQQLTTKENLDKVTPTTMEEQTVPSAGFSPQPNPFESINYTPKFNLQVPNNYVNHHHQQQQQHQQQYQNQQQQHHQTQNQNQHHIPNQQQQQQIVDGIIGLDSYGNLGDTFDFEMSLLDNPSDGSGGGSLLTDCTGYDLATVPSPSSWSLSSGSGYEGTSWNHTMSLYAASPTGGSGNSPHLDMCAFSPDSKPIIQALSPNSNYDSSNLNYSSDSSNSYQSYPGSPIPGPNNNNNSNNGVQIKIENGHDELLGVPPGGGGSAGVGSGNGNGGCHDRESQCQSQNQQQSQENLNQQNLLLRQCLADTTFQKKYNFKPLEFPAASLSSLLLMDDPSIVSNATHELDGRGSNNGSRSNNTSSGGNSAEFGLGLGFGLNGIEPVFSMAFEHIRSDIHNACSTLAISPDPMEWSASDVQSWLTHVLSGPISPMNPILMMTSGDQQQQQHQQQQCTATALRQFWNCDGRTMCSFSEEEFRLRDPVSGDGIFYNLELWKMLQFQNQNQNLNNKGQHQQSQDGNSTNTNNNSNVPPPAIVVSRPTSMTSSSNNNTNSLRGSIISAAGVPGSVSVPEVRTSSSGSNFDFDELFLTPTTISSMLNSNSNNSSDLHHRSPTPQLSSSSTSQGGGVVIVKEENHSVNIERLSTPPFETSHNSTHEASPSSLVPNSAGSGSGTEPMHTDDDDEEDDEDCDDEDFDSSEAPSASKTSASVVGDKAKGKKSKGAAASNTGTGTGSGSGSAPSATPKSGAHIHLWQFLKELLSAPQQHGSCIRWLDQSRGVFKIEDSVRVARLWGLRKNRPAMNYDKLSRSIRQYYRKGIMRKTERSQRLVYQFCHPYGL